MEVQRPDVTPDQAANLAIKLYKVDVAKVEELMAYDGRNFTLTGKNGTRYILKISNASDSRKLDYIEMQNKVMDRLMKFGCKVQVSLPSSSNRQVEVEELWTTIDSSGCKNHRPHAVRLLTYLPGIPMSEESVIFTPTLLHKVGCEIGVLSVQLNQHCSDIANYPTHPVWNLCAVSKLRQIVSVLKNAQLRAYVMQAVEEFEEKVTLDVLNSLTKSIAHGDLAPQNLLIDGSEISGFLDWEEVHSGYALFDLAVSSAHCMMLHSSQRAPGISLSDVAKICADGFCSARPLPEWELLLLPTLIPCRMAQVVCLTQEAILKSSDSNPYLEKLVCKASRLLTLLNNQNGM